MKSLLDIRNEILDVTNKTPTSVSGYSDARSRLAFLRVVEMYLEGNPTDWFIEMEKKRLVALLDKISCQYCEALYSKLRNPYDVYSKDMCVPYIELQLKALKYIKR